MSLRDGKAELRPPDAKRHLKGDHLRPVSPASAIPISVHDRRKMFEQTDSAERIGKRSTRSSTRKGVSEINRSGSFKGSKKIRLDDSSPVLQHRQYSSSALWQRLRSFGHYDLQSMTIEKLASEKALSERSLKKATGASAAHLHYGDEEALLSSSIANDLVATCPAFMNEVGGDLDWLSEHSPIQILRHYLSHEKQKRVGSRERLVLDGVVPPRDRGREQKPREMMSWQAREMFKQQSGFYYPFEFIDYGSSYYRNYFLGQEHQNFIGVDESVGPVAISLKREKVPDNLPEFYGTPRTLIPTGLPKNQYRIIIRTSQLATLRGAILEEAIPSGTKIGTSRGIPPRDVLEYVTQGELQLTCLKLAKQQEKVYQELVRLDEQELNNRYKIGVIYCKKGQTMEEEMYNNEHGSPAFEEFLALLGKKVKMKGFTKYRAQLDNKTDTTGEHSVYTEFRDTEIMFHVSTLLPYTPSNKQQLLRKRHIGNDIVTVIFQEPGCQPFSPKSIRSQFQHIFVVVQVENPGSSFTKYRVAVTRSRDIPYFGPSIPEGAIFDKNDQFREFMLTKLINACNASLRSEKFSGMAMRTRKQYLLDMVENFTSNLNIDQANNSGIVAGFLSRNWGGRKRERTRQLGPLIYTPGALTWNVSIIFRNRKPLPFSEDYDYHIDCIMGLGPDVLVFLEANTKEAILHIPTNDISGWVNEETRMNIFYDTYHCVSLESYEMEEDVREIASRLQAVAPRLTASHEATLMDFHRGSNGLLGFGINEAGVVQKVDGLARSVGLQTHARLLQVEDRLVCSYTHPRIMELLTDRHKLTVRAYVIPPSPKDTRELLHYPPQNWSAIWASRPSHNGDSEEQEEKVANGPEPMDTSQPVKLRKSSQVSNASRRSYIEAIAGQELEMHGIGLLNLPYDDDEPVYDRLMSFDTDKVQLRRPKSPRIQRQRDENVGYTRVRRTQRAVRESVVQFADDLMERGMGRMWQPEAMEHTIDVVSSQVHTHVATSTTVPRSKPQTAESLASLRSHRRAGSVEPRRPAVDVGSVYVKEEVPLTPGQVHELAKRFSFSPASTPSTGTKVTPSRIPVATGHSTPMKATTSAAQMTKPGTPVRPTAPADKSEAELQLRSNKRSIRIRPASWDASLIFNGEKGDTETSKDDSTSEETFEDSTAGQSFTRNSNIRTAFRRKSQSREFSPEPPTDDSTTQAKERPPATGTPETMTPTTPTKEKVPHKEPRQGSGSSQEEKENLSPMSVRERTKRWEARGGGLPSYLTLPRCRKLKSSATSGSNQSSRLSCSDAPTLTERERSNSADTAKSRHSSLSGIPQPIAGKIRSPRSSSTKAPPTSKLQQAGSSVSTSRIPSATSKPRSTSGKTSPQLTCREEADGSSNPDEPLQKGTETKDEPQTTEAKTSETEKCGAQSEAETVSSGRKPVIMKGVSASSGKSRGQSLLPTRTQIPTISHIPVSTQRTSQPAVSPTSSSPVPQPKEDTDGEEKGPARATSPVSKVTSPIRRSSVEREITVVVRKSSIPRPIVTSQRSTTDSGTHTNVSQGTVRKSSAPPSGKPPSIPRPMRTSAGSRSGYSSPTKSFSPTSQGSNIPFHFRQKSGESTGTGSSLDNSLDLHALPTGIQELSLSGSHGAQTDSSERLPADSFHSGHGHYTPSIEEWIRQTSENAVEPDALQPQEPHRDISSPTFTDGSISYSQTSDCSQEVMESLKQRVEYLESKLEKEAENNAELRGKLRKVERQLHGLQHKHSRGAKTMTV